MGAWVTVVSSWWYFVLKLEVWRNSFVAFWQGQWALQSFLQFLCCISAVLTVVFSKSWRNATLVFSKCLELAYETNIVPSCPQLPDLSPLPHNKELFLLDGTPVDLSYIITEDIEAVCELLAFVDLGWWDIGRLECWASSEGGKNLSDFWYARDNGLLWFDVERYYTWATV